MKNLNFSEKIQAYLFGFTVVSGFFWFTSWIGKTSQVETCAFVTRSFFWLLVTSFIMFQIVVPVWQRVKLKYNL
ncbi:MAG: hypothetical protein KKB03_04700 [Nanoarchaeota archaeon]|nr:hypothetical protein [Nanoarchaeota archaeon]MBU1135323.1 hypothetical protein [Nanoarchaeota archaeon]MBU2520512.1 hypothetical protein [Nanoarchaeota archaeon]